MDSSVDVDVLVSAYEIATQTPKVQEVQYLRVGTSARRFFWTSAFVWLAILKSTRTI